MQINTPDGPEEIKGYLTINKDEKLTLWDPTELPQSSLPRTEFSLNQRKPEPSFDDLIKIFRTHMEHLLSEIAHDDESENLPGAIITEAVSLCNEDYIMQLWR